MEARVRAILDPLGQGIPRRAAIHSETGLVVDILRYPGLKEVDALSEICHAVFQTEPRDPSQLVHRALVLNVATAWNALRDDLSLGITYKIAGDDVGHVIRCLMTQPNETQAYVCSTLITTNPLEQWSFDVERVITHVATLDSDAVCDAFQRVITFLGVSMDLAGRIVSENPHTCRLFLRCPKLADVYTYAPGVVGAVCDYARSLRPSQRYPPLAFLAILCHAGIRVPPDVGVETMVKLRKTTYDAKLAAAAAVIIQGSEDSTVRAFGNVIESLAAHLQKVSTTIPEKRDPSN
jgi:hypothetical protein